MTTQEAINEAIARGAAAEGRSTPNELALLLTVARILRARLPEMATAYQEDDLAALNEALAPFDPSPGHGGDYCAAPAEQDEGGD